MSVQGAYYLYFDSASAGCPEDSFEPNDRDLDATALPDGTVAAGSCTGTAQFQTDDWYTYTPQTNGSVSVTVYYDEQDLDLVGEVDGTNMTAGTNRLTISNVNVSSGTPVEIGVRNVSGQGAYFLEVTEN